MASFSIVLPFAEYTDEVRKSLSALSRCESLSRFEIILVWNNVMPMGAEIEAEIRYIMSGAPIRILQYPDKQGPSQAWCFGLRQATTDYVCFLAVDAPVAPFWDAAVIESVDGKVEMYQGDYSAAAHDDVCGRLEGAIDRVRFAGLRIIDFRNFVIRRSTALAILEDHFRGLFFSDVELDLLLARLPSLSVKKMSGARVVNFYPRTLLRCARRKFRHGVGVGRIIRRFPTPEIRAKLGPAGRKQKRDSGTSGSNLRFIFRTIALTEGLPAKLALAAMHVTFFSAAVLGWALPGKFARQFYVMHFDNQDIARKISAG